MIEPGDIVRCIRGDTSVWAPKTGKLYLVKDYHDPAKQYLLVKELTKTTNDFDGGGWARNRFEKI